jgi:hypothetical protein
MILLSLTLATMVSAQTPAPTAPAKKKPAKSTKAKAEPAPATAPAAELKPAPPPAPVAAPNPAPAPMAAPAPTPVAPAPVVERPAEPAPAPASSAPNRLLIGALGGIVTPFSVLATGERVGVVAEYHFGALPLGVLLNVAFEQHTAVQSALFAPPAGGLDPAAIENQAVVPIELAVAWSAWRDDANRLALAAGYGVVPTSTQTRALGSTTLEEGIGHEVLGEVGYTRVLGPVNLLVRLRYAVRHTAVGVRTSTVELPWYQSFGVSAGLAFGL